MVKIEEVDEQPDAACDEDCYEIDPAEFAKKVNLKETDDVILVASKGKTKLEMVEPENFAKASSGCGCRVRECGGVTCDSRQEFAAGYSMDNPLQIEEDEPVFLQMEVVEDRFALDRSPPAFGADENNCSDEHFTAATPYKIVVKKAEPEDLDLDGVDGVGHDAYDHCDEMNSVPGAEDYHQEDHFFFHGAKDDVNFVSDELGAQPSGTSVYNGVVEVVHDDLVAMSEPVDSDSVKGAGEDTYDHCLETIRKRSAFDEEEYHGFVIVWEG